MRQIMALHALAHLGVLDASDFDNVLRQSMRAWLAQDAQPRPLALLDTIAGYRNYRNQTIESPTVAVPRAFAELMGTDLPLGIGKRLARLAPAKDRDSRELLAKHIRQTVPGFVMPDGHLAALDLDFKAWCRELEAHESTWRFKLGKALKHWSARLWRGASDSD